MNAILRRRVRSTATFGIWGAVAGLVLGLVVSRLDERIVFWGGVRGVVVGILIGLLLGAGEEFMVPRLSRRMNFQMLNLTRVLSYATISLMALVLVNAFALSLSPGVTLGDSVSLYITDPSSVRDLVLAIVLALVLTSALQVRRLHNKGEIKRLLTGQYYYPQEESRVFLFADLVSSTAHAERLGPLRYSRMLRDLFTDISDAILAWHGQVYQYAGDEVILSWPLQRGVRDAACVQCFFEMVASLDERANQYRDRFETAPELRGAVHGGPVVTTWVGEAKRELAFHGDTLNATARILSLCKDQGARLLISEEVLDLLTLPPALLATSVGEVELRGKRELVRLSAIGAMKGHG